MHLPRRSRENGNPGCTRQRGRQRPETGEKQRYCAIPDLIGGTPRTSVGEINHRLQTCQNCRNLLTAAPGPLSLRGPFPTAEAIPIIGFSLGRVNRAYHPPAPSGRSFCRCHRFPVRKGRYLYKKGYALLASWIKNIHPGALSRILIGKAGIHHRAGNNI